MSLDKKIEKAIVPLTDMYEKIQNDLLVMIARHFKITDEFLNSDYWRIRKLEEMGMFNQEVIDYIARYSGKAKDNVLNALNKVGVDTINISKLKGLFEDEVLKVNPNVLVNNYTIKKMIETSYNELENTFISLSSKVIQATREEYLKVVENAYLKTAMGTHSYQEAIRESLNDLGNKGITTLTYTTTDDEGNVVGIRNYDIEGTARREILNGARHLSTDISMQVVEELNCEYVYISEHLECRPTHFDWQGTVVKREELDMSPINYGKVDGLCGINCRHYFEPYFGKARGKDLKHLNQEECSEAYSLSQKQRYFERGVRKWQRKAEMFKASEDMEAYSKCKSKTKEWQLRTKEFTEENNLRRDFTREYVTGNNTALPREKEPEKVLMIKPKYDNLTELVNKNSAPIKKIDRKLNYSIDSKGNKHSDCFFEKMKKEKIEEEKKYRKILESKLLHKVYRNPKTYGDFNKTPDYWVEGIEQLWDLKGIDGNSNNVIDNILHNASRNFQTPNIVLLQRETEHSIVELEKQLKYIFENEYKKKIKQVMLFDKNDNLIAYYKR